MILRTIKCSVKGCSQAYTEKTSNSGFPGWGHISGVYNDKTDEYVAHLCPSHLKIVIIKLLNAGMEEKSNDMG